MDKKTIIDSEMTREEALKQNPQSEAPLEILESLELIEVGYFGFDNNKHSGQIVMHKDVADDVRQFFKTAFDIKFPIKSVVPICVNKYHFDDEASCADNNTAGYNYRLIAGTNKISKHASGLAFDVNPVQNMFIKYDADQNEIFRFPPNTIYDESSPGTLTNDHPLVILMKNLGWEWGGDWTKESGRTDYQHFEKNI